MSAQQTSDLPISLHDVIKGRFGEAAPQQGRTSRRSGVGRLGTSSIGGRAEPAKGASAPSNPLFPRRRTSTSLRSHLKMKRELISMEISALVIERRHCRMSQGTQTRLASGRSIDGIRNPVTRLHSQRDRWLDTQLQIGDLGLEMYRP